MFTHFLNVKQARKIKYHGSALAKNVTQCNVKTRCKQMNHPPVLKAYTQSMLSVLVALRSNRGSVTSEEPSDKLLQISIKSGTRVSNWLSLQ